MIMGDTCTRACAFCDVKTGKPTDLDIFEPLKISVKKDAKFPDDTPAFEVAFPILLPKDFANPPANGIIRIANKANFQFW